MSITTFAGPPGHVDINVLTKNSECSEPDSCVVMVKWTHADDSETSYTVTVVPQTDVNFVSNLTISLLVSYNTLYSVSILSTLCGIEDATTIPLHYGTQIYLIRVEYNLIN